VVVRAGVGGGGCGGGSGGGGGRLEGGFYSPVHTESALPLQGHNIID